MDEEHGKIGNSVEQATDSDGDEKRTVQYMLNSPTYMSSIMRRQLLQEMVKAMPKPAQDRVAALKNLQLKHLEIESNFFEEVKIFETLIFCYFKSTLPILMLYIGFHLQIDFL